MKSSPHPLTRQSTEVVLKDSDRRSERGGVNGSPIKILLDENKAYVPIQLKTSLSYNRQSDASQLVTCSPYERLGKSRRKRKHVKNNLLEQGTTQNASNDYQVPQKLFKHTRTKSRRMQRFNKDYLKLKNKRKQSSSKRPIKSLTKKIRTNHHKRVLLIKHAKTYQNYLTQVKTTKHTKISQILSSISTNQFNLNKYSLRSKL